MYIKGDLASKNISYMLSVHQDADVGMTVEVWGVVVWSHPGSEIIKCCDPCLEGGWTWDMYEKILLD